MVTLLPATAQGTLSSSTSMPDEGGSGSDGSAGRTHSSQEPATLVRTPDEAALVAGQDAQALADTDDAAADATGDADAARRLALEDVRERDP
jgi:hypothetical protein